MVLRLDPRYPVAWRTPTSMQLGFTGHPLVIDDVSPAAERMVAALIAGVSRTGLRMIGRTAGASELEVDDLLHLLGPALTPEQPPRPWAVTVVGSGTTADTIAGLLGVAGMAVTAARTAAIATRVPADLAVVVGNFAIRSDLSRLWLQRDVPHLAVVLGDDAADVGPLVVPGGSACLLCVAHHCLRTQDSVNRLPNRNRYPGCRDSTSRPRTPNRSAT